MATPTTFLAYLGQVEHANPLRGVYTVRLLGGGTVMAVAASPCSTERRGGTKSATTYLSGSWVVVLHFGNFEGSNPPGLRFYIILGAIPANPLITRDNDGTPVPDDFPIPRGTPDAPYDYRGNPLFERVVAHDPPKLPILAQDYSYNRRRDLAPGEYGVTTALGGMIRLADFLAEFGVSPACRALLDYRTGRFGIQAQQYSLDLECFRQELLRRGDNLLGIHGVADNVVEGMGGLGVAAYKQTTEKNVQPQLVLVEANQFGMFRSYGLSGGDTEGLWLVHQAPEKTAVVNTYDSAPVGLVSEQRRNDGVWRMRAAREIRLEKTPVIRVPEECQDPRQADRTDDQPAVKTDDDMAKALLGPDATAAQLRSVLYILYGASADYEESNIFFRGLRQDLFKQDATGIWYLAPRDEIRQRATDDAKEPGLDVVGDTDQEYDLESLLSSKSLDVGAGRKVQLFKNSSVFLMEENGNLVIGDGSGSEIRFQGGRIIIAPAISLELAPGRDLIAQVPRNVIMRARDRMEFVSTRGSQVFKANENQSLLSGVSGAGSTVIENRAAQTDWKAVTADTYRRNLPVGSGIVLKSRLAAMSLLSPSFYFGGAHASMNPGSHEGTNESADFYFNGGRMGTFTVSAGSSYLLGYQQAVVALTQDLAGLFVTPGASYLVNNTLAMATEQMLVDKMASTNVTVPFLTANGLQQSRLHKTFTRTALVVQGTAEIAGDLFLTQDMAVGRGIASKDGINGQLGMPASLSASFRVQVPPSQAKLISSGVIQAYNVSTAPLSMLLGHGIGTDIGQQAADLAYPASKDGYTVDVAKYQLYSTRWQSLLKGGATWMELALGHAIAGETMPYPGKDVFDRKDAWGLVSPTPSAGSTIAKKALTEYLMNRQS